MLRDLKYKLAAIEEKKQSERMIKRYYRDSGSDLDIAVNIVDKIFDEISYSMKHDNVSLVAKGFIQSLVLRENTIEGVKDFIRNMDDYRAKLLIDFIEAECKKRKI